MRAAKSADKEMTPFHWPRHLQIRKVPCRSGIGCGRICRRQNLNPGIATSLCSALTTTCLARSDHKHVQLPGIMQTTLPDLHFSYPSYISGDYIRPEPQRHPRPNLQSLLPWFTFENDIHQAILAAMATKRIPIGSELEVDGLGATHPRRMIEIKCEEEVRGYADNRIHDTAADVLNYLGVVGHFRPTNTGYNATIGEPDFVWFSKEIERPTLLIEYNTDWETELTNLEELWLRQHTSQWKPSEQERRSRDALLQMYGYMTFNDNDYAVLSNLTHSWFFRRIRTEGGRIFQCACVKLNGDSISMLKAFVGIVLLAEKNSSLASSAVSLVPSNLYFSSDSNKAEQERQEAIIAAHNYEMLPIGGTYPCLPIDIRLCQWIRPSIRHSEKGGCVARAKFPLDCKDQMKITVICKLIDVFRNVDSIEWLESEAQTYANLITLQGQVIPRIHGYYDLWGIIKFLMLQDVGVALLEGEAIPNDLCQRMKIALGRIHAAGYIHGDIARRNFCVKGQEVFLVDLEMARAGTAREQQEEMRELDLICNSTLTSSFHDIT